MARKSVRLFLTLNFILLLVLAVVPSGHVQAMTDPLPDSRLPSLDAFVEHVLNGQVDELRGLYIPEILAAPIVQQPDGMYDFVSPWQNIVTEFSLASTLGSTGLMAHNYLAGEAFALLEEGQEFHLVYGGGRISTFVVSEVLHYQALNPDSISSTFVDLGNPSSLSSSELFNKVYNRPGEVVFQTCIQDGDILTWGRLFVIAEPAVP